MGLMRPPGAGACGGLFIAAALPARALEMQCHRFARSSGQTDADDAHCRTAQTCSQPSAKPRSGAHHGECATSERCFASELVFGKLELSGVAGVCLQVDAESCDADGAGCEPLLTFESGDS